MTNLFFSVNSVSLWLILFLMIPRVLVALSTYDVLVTMDADWSHEPQYLVALVNTAADADVALGSRYCTGGAIDGWPMHRRVLSRAANALTRLLLRLPIHDASGAFRAYRVTTL